VARVESHATWAEAVVTFIEDEVGTAQKFFSKKESYELTPIGRERNSWIAGKRNEEAVSVLE